MHAYILKRRTVEIVKSPRIRAKIVTKIATKIGKEFSWEYLAKKILYFTHKLPHDDSLLLYFNLLCIARNHFPFFHFPSPFFHSCFPIKGKGGKGRVTISSRSFRNEKDILIELTLLPFRFPLSGGSIKNFHRLNRGLIYCGRLLSVQIPGKKGVARTREGRRSRFVRRILSRHRGSLNPPHDSRRYFIHRESRGFNFTPFYDTLPCLRFVITFDAGKRAWPPPPFRGKEKKKETRGRSFSSIHRFHPHDCSTRRTRNFQISDRGEK